jgi:hypothetical protein
MDKLDRDRHEVAVTERKTDRRPRLRPEEFAKISEVEGIRLSEEMREAFAEFDRQGLSDEERRRAIISRHRRPSG